MIKPSSLSTKKIKSYHLANVAVILMIIILSLNGLLFLAGVYVPHQLESVILFLGLLVIGIVLSFRYKR